MAFNRQVFKTRALTAIIFAMVMLAGLLWNHWSFLLLFSVIHFGCWWEYLKLTEKIHQTTFHPYTKMGWMVMGYGLMLWFCSTAYHFGGYGISANLSLPVSAAGFALLLLGIFQKNPVQLKAFGMAALGVIYISLCWGLMLDLRREFFLAGAGINNMKSPAWHEIIAPCAIIASIWINDTMAYIVGSLIGKTPLSKVSPKKTWEGTSGGILLALVIIGSLSAALHFSIGEMIVIAFISSVTGTFGDLLESKLKRMANVKDSGSIMPGHGGFLDRFDSLLLAIPFVWLFIRVFMS
jgi:phosphatidate cytidylyltransferase